MTAAVDWSRLSALRAPKIHDYRRETLGPGHEIRRFEALGQGRYSVQGIGAGLASGDRVRFTLKGSSTLELILEVLEVKSKLVPTNGWSAVLEGEDFSSFDIHRWSVRCDGCGRAQPFEFVAPERVPPAALQAAASVRIEGLGWSTRRGHRCPDCEEAS